MNSKTENHIIETAPFLVLQFFDQQEAKIYNSKFLLANKAQPTPEDIKSGLHINHSVELVDTASHTAFTTFENKFINPRPKNICAVYSFFCDHEIEVKITSLMLQDQTDLGKIHEYTLVHDYGKNNYFSKVIECRTFSQITNIRSFERCFEIISEANEEPLIYWFMRMTIDFGLMEIERFAQGPRQGTLEAVIPGSFSRRAG